MFELISLKNGLENVAGFRFGGVNSGFKSNGDNDLGFIAGDEPFDVCAKFTSNKFQAAPIKHFQRYGAIFKSNFLLLNSKNANSMTGEAGIQDIEFIFSELAKAPNFRQFRLQNPIMSSTGVIGYRLDTDKIISAASKFDLNSRNSDAVAHAIMTTDKFKKEIAFRVDLENGASFNIACICKGAGMINPALATMLCFVLTDAAIPQADVDELLESTINSSFNTISVDGDTSTNDTLMLLSSAKSGAYDKAAFKFALEKITKIMAINLVKDGEGSSKVVAFEVRGAYSEDDARKAAKALANSLLVKTAIFGEDPNWGRIASTIGASGVECDESKLSIYYDDVLVFNVSCPQLDAEREKKACEVMKKSEYKIICDLGLGKCEFTAFGCDLGHEYVNINADYRS